ncbi:FAD-dependent oxidoreductase [Muricoccus aerilatus]|uniref:FAD-dependent oxidoreductase n=1 Tax=Muricoccus aerilatus TaxID=452982 RepID=UPI0005C1C8FB|nr:FAD-dependent oxidoreductase [Roseomonas aerilata]
MQEPERIPVLIAGGGPCGLMLAIELARRRVGVVLVDDKPGTAFNPQANATQARTMEHYRRLGFADEIRALGMPDDYPTDIAYFTRFAGYELARFKLPSAKEARARVSGLSGSWSAAELPHRVSQKFVERVLREKAQAAGATLLYGWRLDGFEEGAGGVAAAIEAVDGSARRELHADYLVGADGPRSPVRSRLGIRYAGSSGVARDFMGGRMYALYLRCPAFYDVVPHAKAWMNVTYNRDRRAFMAAVDGAAEFAFHTQLRDGEDEEAITEAQARAMFERAVGRSVPAEILSRTAWTAGHALVAESFGRGRVLIAGDAAHLFTPAGGLGYNTAVEDAVNLGWKLASVVKGIAAPALLDSYGLERGALARRNTAYARELADSLAYRPADPALESDTPKGEAARREAGEHLGAHARREFNIPGITFGGRYDGSPIIVPDGTAPPPDAMNRYEPTACPGGRPPHAWLGEGRSLYDLFGPEWTLLRLGPAPAKGFSRAAAVAGLDLRVVEPGGGEALRDLYGRDLVLIRPDHIVAWRGNDAGQAPAVLAQAAGLAA